MTRHIGTSAYGIRTPIFNQGDDLIAMIPELIQEASKAEEFPIRDRDIIAITESIVARAQGNYASIKDIEADVRDKLDGRDHIGLTLPILSRNRFSLLLKGIAGAVKKVTIQLSYPADEVGNHLFDNNLLISSNINPWKDVLTEDEFYNNFGKSSHPFTGIDYIQLYKEITNQAGAECEIIFANDCRKILDFTKNVIVCDVHTRKQSLQKLKSAGSDLLLSLSDILNQPTSKHGYNEKYGLLGSNKATDTIIKLFPRDCQNITNRIAEKMLSQTGKQVEVMIYGDGAFKDPVGKIWELADPVVSPAYTPGLAGKPHELKIKYLADNEYQNLSRQEMEKEIAKRIKAKDKTNNKELNEKSSEGTTPRKITDLLGSLADLVSGSGDKGTPIVYIQGYFDNFADK